MSDKDSNAPAKNWQVNNLKDSIERLAKAVDKIDRKLDDKYSTKEYVDSKIELLESKYDPMRKNISKLIWIVIPIVLSLVAGQVWALITNIQS